jgi:SAM-dependent methyltransferase
MHITNQFFSITVLLAGIVLCYLLYIKYWKLGTSTRIEGFQQSERFLLKSNSDVYDNFYGEIYDQLMLPTERVHYEADKLIQTMMPDKESSIMLDIGCGTGEFVNYLTDLGYKSYGVDKSDAMMDAAKRKYADIEIKKADVTDPMCYDSYLFSHIFCMDLTVYEIKNKPRLFKNCHYWLQNGGYFILHLADKDQFQPIVPAARSAPFSNLSANERIRNTEINFPDFTYKSEYLDVGADSDDTPSATNANTPKCDRESKCENQLFHRETFVDKRTQNVRQNEKMLYMDPIEEIIQMVFYAGFTAKGFFTLEEGPSRDKHQRIYIFQKI